MGLKRAPSLQPHLPSMNALRAFLIALGVGTEPLLQNVSSLVAPSGVSLNATSLKITM